MSVVIWNRSKSWGVWLMFTGGGGDRNLVSQGGVDDGCVSDTGFLTWSSLGALWRVLVRNFRLVVDWSGDLSGMAWLGWLV